MTQQRAENDLALEYLSKITRQGRTGCIFVEVEEGELEGPFQDRGEAIAWLQVTLDNWQEVGENAFSHPELGTVQLNQQGNAWNARTLTGRGIGTTRSALSGVVHLRRINKFTRYVRSCGFQFCNWALASIVVAPAVGALRPEQCLPGAMLMFLLFLATRDRSDKKDNASRWLAVSAGGLALSLVNVAFCNQMFAEVVATSAERETGRALAIGGAIAYVIGRWLVRVGSDFYREAPRRT